MKRRFIFFFIIVVVLFTISVSFNIVQALSGTPAPGSDQDPLVSKSYVDSAVGQATTALGQANAALQKLQQQYDDLQKAFDGLNAKLADQDQTIKTLQDALKNIKTTDAQSSQTSQTSQTSGGNTSAQDAGAKKGVVNTASLNVRSQANTTSTIVAKALKGETVTLVSKSGDWYKIKTSKGVTGYVMAKYMTVK